jgi:hypothetical protein
VIFVFLEYDIKSRTRGQKAGVRHAVPELEHFAGHGSQRVHHRRNRTVVLRIVVRLPFRLVGLTDYFFLLLLA